VDVTLNASLRAIAMPVPSEMGVSPTELPPGRGVRALAAKGGSPADSQSPLDGRAQTEPAAIGPRGQLGEGAGSGCFRGDLLFHSLRVAARSRLSPSCPTLKTRPFRAAPL
jgi:hypothetical protein